MTTTELIAATIAAHTPIGARYQLVAVPGTELTDACLDCDGAHHVQQCGELRAELGRFDADSTIAWLREELDEARNHIGALCAAIEHETAAYNAYMHCLDDDESARRADEHLKTSIAQAKTLDAARTWLRREAK